MQLYEFFSLHFWSFLIPQKVVSFSNILNLKKSERYLFFEFFLRMNLNNLPTFCCCISCWSLQTFHKAITKHMSTDINLTGLIIKRKLKKILPSSFFLCALPKTVTMTAWISLTTMSDMTYKGDRVPVT